MELKDKIFDVEQSQLIERINPEQQSQLFRQHLKALDYVHTEVETGVLPDVKKVHMIMMVSELFTAGSYRYHEAHFIDGTYAVEFPASTYVSSLMEDWTVLGNAFLGQKMTNAKSEEASKRLYFELMCIHPFEDGNGRVGRLVYNAFRLLMGLSWLTVSVNRHNELVSELRIYEEDVFRPRYGNFYKRTRQ